MKFCPTCKATYADDANFCPKETCATPSGPQRLQDSPAVVGAAPVVAATGAPDTGTRFQLGPRLGGSSTGEVYRATDTGSGAQVAFKIVASDVLPNAAAFARAEREFKQLMRVQSPRIASIIDCGRTSDERLYVAMELCEGESLERTLRGDPIPLDRAKAIVAQIGQALLEAQKAGIVHRDVSPKNVLVMPSGEIKVINFPLAKPINDRASGVAAYLSPEQVQGKPVDQRSNTYNLAAVLYHLLTGEPPFQGSPETVLELHVGSPPLAPSQRRPEANLPADVDRVILKALDKSSSRRHLTLRLFLSEVESLVAPSAPSTAANQGREHGGGFARTMLFAGGQAEVASLVAKAIAARGGSPAGGVPITPTAPASATVIGSSSGPSSAGSGGAISFTTPAGGAPRRQPSPVATPVQTAGSGPVSGLGATMSAPPPAGSGPIRLVSPVGGVPTAVSPAPSPATASATGAVTEPQRPRVSTPAAGAHSGAAPISTLPVTQAVPPVAAAPTPAPAPTAAAPQPGGAMSVSAGSAAAAPSQGAGNKGGKDGKGTAFRETLWFKKGDVEHMIAEARAKIANPEGKASVEAPSPTEEVLPIEDRYIDDGTLTQEDRKKFSLRSGGTAASLPAVTAKARVPGERMSDDEVIREVSGSRKIVVLLVLVVLVVAAGAAILTFLRSKPTEAPSLPPAAHLIPAPPAPPAAAPVPKASSGDQSPTPPELRKGAKLVAAPPSKRSDGSEDRATRRKVKDRRKRR